jgi:hypothetical protein
MSSSLNLDNLRLSSQELDHLTGLDISPFSMGWAYRVSVLQQPKQLLIWLVNQLLTFGVALIFCVPLTLLLGRWILGIEQTAAALKLLPLGIGVAFVLTLVWVGFLLYRGQRLKTLGHLLDEIDHYNEMLSALEILAEIKTANPQFLPLDHHTGVIEALHVARESLICGLMSERILRKHQRFIARRYDLFVSIERNLTTLQALQVATQANEYGQLLQEALQVGSRVHAELRQFHH